MISMNIPVVPSNLDDRGPGAHAVRPPWRQARRMGQLVFEGGRYNGSRLQDLLATTARSRAGAKVEAGHFTSPGDPTWRWVTSNDDWLAMTPDAMWRVRPDAIGGLHAAHLDVLALTFSSQVYTRAKGRAYVVANNRRQPAEGELFRLTSEDRSLLPDAVVAVLDNPSAQRVLVWQDPSGEGID